METMEGTMEFTLKSGNCALFFYCEGIPHMLVLNRQTVIGGCFGMEADRKKKLFLRTERENLCQKTILRNAGLQTLQNFHWEGTCLAMGLMLPWPDIVQLK